MGLDRIWLDNFKNDPPQDLEGRAAGLSIGVGLLVLIEALKPAHQETCSADEAGTKQEQGSRFGDGRASGRSIEIESSGGDGLRKIKLQLVNSCHEEC